MQIMAELDSTEARLGDDAGIARAHRKDMEQAWGAALDDHLEGGRLRDQARWQLRRARRAGDLDLAVEMAHRPELREAQSTSAKLSTGPFPPNIPWTDTPPPGVMFSQKEDQS